MSNRNRAYSQDKPYKELQTKMFLLDLYIDPSLKREPNLVTQSTFTTINKKSSLNKSFQQPIVNEMDELKEVESVIDLQNKQLRKLMKEQRETQRELSFKRDIQFLKQQVENISVKFPKLPQFEQYEDIKSEIRTLKHSFLQQQQQQQQQQQYYHQYPQYPPYPQYQYQQYPQYQQYNPYNPYNPQGYPQQQQQYFQQPLPQLDQKPSLRLPQSRKSNRSQKSQVSSIKQSRQQTQQSHKTNQLVPYKQQDTFYSLNKDLKTRLRIIFLTVVAAMRWKIWCKPINILWRKLLSHLSDCKAQIQKLTQQVVLQRINNWSLMVLAKVSDFISKAKNLNFIDNKLTTSQLDHSYTSLTTGMTYLINSLVTYSTIDFVIPELKLLCYVQFFEQPEIDRGVFVARRVLFWKEGQLDMTKTQQMMIICELVILVHILPTLLGMNGSLFLIKAIASLTQIHLMKFFDLRVLNRYPNYHMVNLDVELVENKYQITLKEIDKIEEEQYINGLYQEVDFAQFYKMRPKFEEDVQKAFDQISENLLYSLMSK